MVVGQGDNIVPAILKNEGAYVSTFDFIDDMNPTYLGDVRKLFEVVGAAKFDCVLCCEVLEHIPFADFSSVITQFRQCSNRRVVLSLPVCDRGYYIKAVLPKLPDVYIPIYISLLKKKLLCENHCWEINDGVVTLEMVLNVLKQEFKVVDRYRVPENPYHMFFILELA